MEGKLVQNKSWIKKERKKEKDYLGDLGVDGRLLSDWNRKTQTVRERTSYS